MIPAMQRLRQFRGSVLLGALLAACGGAPVQPPQAATAAPALARAAPVRHVFLLLLENEDYERSFGPGSPAVYLSQQLPAQGAHLRNYYGTVHYSLGNYLALISGQGPTPQIQADCHSFDDFAASGTAAEGQLIGQGCVYPASVRTLPDQLEAAGLSWRGYMEDMGNTPERESGACGHPPANSADHTQKATAADAYATRHDPFVYFHSISDDQARCARGVVNLRRLPDDLASAETTPNFVFITPSLCHDGHDSPCVSGEPGGLVSADGFLRQWVPQILASPAFRQDGLLIITFDESNGPHSDSSACCGEVAGPNSAKPGITGPGGGRVGAVLLSPFIKPGTVSAQPYNHYSTLRSIEQIFGLPYLGYAGSVDQSAFGADVYTALPQDSAAR